MEGGLITLFVYERRLTTGNVYKSYSARLAETYRGVKPQAVEIVRVPVTSLCSILHVGFRRVLSDCSIFWSTARFLESRGFQ